MQEFELQIIEIDGKKVFKRCSTIAIRIGEFRKMDSQRVPSFIRFSL